MNAASAGTSLSSSSSNGKRKIKMQNSSSSHYLMFLAVVVAVCRGLAVNLLAYSHRAYFSQSGGDLTLPLLLLLDGA